MPKKTGIVFKHKAKHRKLVDVEWGTDNSFYFMPCTDNAQIGERIKTERDPEGRLVLSIDEVQAGCFPTAKISRHPSGYFHIKDTVGAGGRREKDGLIGPAFKDINGFFVFLVACPQAIDTLVETPAPHPTDVIVNLPEGIEPFTVQFALWDKTKTISIPVQNGQVLGNGAVTLEIDDLNFGLVIMLMAVGKPAPDTVVRWPARTCYIVM
jgi:hypothetical protein